MPHPNLYSQSLLLRQLGENDLQNVFRGLSHPEVIKYYGVNYRSLEDTKEQIEWFAKLEENGTGIWWAICSLNNSIFFGAIGLNNLNQEHKKAEIGYWLLPDFWGKGIVQEAGKEVLEYCFSSLGLHRIEAFVEVGNENSEKLLKKLSFKLEGTMRDCEIKNGQFVSLKLFAKLNLK